MAAVVAIRVTERSGEAALPAGRRRFDAGTGFFISSEGHVVAAYHIVDGASKVQVLLQEGTGLEARILGQDRRSGLALLKVAADRNFPSLSFAEKEPRIGELLLELTPRAPSNRTVVSAVDPLFLKMEAHAPPAGGPVVNVDGEVAGIVMASLRSKDGSASSTVFAVPAKLAARVMNELRAKGKVEHGWLGLQMLDVSAADAQGLGLSEPKGVMITDLVADGPDSAAGLKVGDVVLQINDLPVKNARDLTYRLADLRPGTTVRLVVVRNREQRLLDARLGLMPDAITKPHVKQPAQ
jgi:serine protease Do